MSFKSDRGRLARSTVFAAVAGVAAGSSSEAATRLGPPTEELLAEHVVVFVAEARGAGEGRVRFARQLALHGDAPEEIALRASAAGLARVEPGKRYVVGYSKLRKDPLFREGLQLHPDGPGLVELSAIGEALFPDSPGLRLLATTGAAAAGAGAQLDALLGELENDDERTRRLAALELNGRPELRALVDGDGLARVRRAFDSARLDPFSRDFLLRAANGFPQALGRGWLAEACRSVVARFGPQFDLSSDEPQLVRTAVGILGEHGRPADLELLVPLFGSNNPGVSKSALEALDQLDREGAVEAVRRALQSDDLHAETRRALGVYLERPREG